jgi:hypothetical protein
MVNGTETSIVLETSNALYTKLVDSNAYPTNAAGIGMRSSGTTADTFMYECGMLVAYTAGVEQNKTPLPPGSQLRQPQMNAVAAPQAAGIEHLSMPPYRPA